MIKKKYDPKKIEAKWQRVWEKSGIYEAKDFSKKPKWYSLIEFPYPSGDGLHTGHIRSNTAMDIISRKRRMEGYNVLYPIGWDAFGLPTENYAIKTGIHPIKVTKKNTDTFRKQLKSIGFSFDWRREINTSDPHYYKFTQWIFLQLFKKGLAYKQKTLVNWCPKDKTGLANEEVVNGCCERCGTPVVKKEKEQWMLAITKYADRLDKDLDLVDYLPQIKTQQRNWIGRSEGSEIEFKVKNTQNRIKVFTTRADTLFGVSYLVLAPDHPLVSLFKDRIDNYLEVQSYVKNTLAKTDTERTMDDKEKSGVRLEGIVAVNPVNNEEIPVFVADYVLASYGTGAVMAVPAHDKRDWDFAKKYNLPIKEVIIPERIDKRNPPVAGKKEVERQNVHAIVYNPQSKKYLCLNWKKYNWKTFPMGGVEEGEDVVQAAQREVLEETGYRDLKFIKVLGGQVKAEYFAAHKDQNRVAYTSAVYFELKSEQKEPVTKTEEEMYDLVWSDWNELTVDKMTHAEMDVWLERLENEERPFTDYGILINSGRFNKLKSEQAKKEITKFVKGKIVTKYKLRDWVFSRQRYWGEPIPLVYCPTCAQTSPNKENSGWVAVKEKDLPVELPKVKDYQPSDHGESPLARVPKWVNTKCPVCGNPAKRETDTMPNWAGSSWYFLRYIDSKNKKTLADFKKLKYWQPVDWYNGGAEHITLHLLYSRFWNKFLYDLGVVPTTEPYQKRTLQGMILGEGGVKMSKSKGNVVNPDLTVKNYGADTLRLYEMFMGPFDQSIAWSTESIIGSRRFLDKIWNISQKVDKIQSTESFTVLTNKTIRKVSDDIELMSFNTAVSAMMVWANEADRLDRVPLGSFELILKLLSPFVPHLAEELWSNLGHKKTIHLEKWPVYDPQKLQEKTVKIIIQVNGKVRDTISVEAGLEQSEIEKIALETETIKRWVNDQPIRKFIYVPDRLLNIVV